MTCLEPVVSVVGVRKKQAKPGTFSHTTFRPENVEARLRQRRTTKARYGFYREENLHCMSWVLFSIDCVPKCRRHVQVQHDLTFAFVTRTCRRVGTSVQHKQAREGYSSLDGDGDEAIHVTVQTSFHSAIYFVLILARAHTHT
nr:hypothetical protein CFP56_36439 [Quercus suber]